MEDIILALIHLKTTLPPVTPSSASTMSTSSFIVPTGGGSWDGQANLVDGEEKVPKMVMI